MNKGLEVIEAHWLFGMAASQIDVVVHPQSIVHSLVEFVDGSMLAQLGATDMRLPIQYAFSFPDRWPSPVPFLDLARAGALEFLAPDWDEFPCLRLAFDALGRRSQPADRAERGQRSGGGVLPRGHAGVSGHSRSDRRGAWPRTGRRRSTRWPQCAAVDAWARETAVELCPGGRIAER